MNLDSLTKIVQEKTGLDEEKARLAVTVVLSQLKTKLPAPVQPYIEQILSGQEAGEAGSVSDIVKGGLGGLMG